MVHEYNVNNTNVEHLDVERRAEARRRSCTTCELWVFGKDGRRKRILDVVTCNSSFRGLSIIAKMPEAIPTGRPIEAVIVGPNKTRTHFAGTVVFCRIMGGEYCEIGMQVQAVGPHWILTGDVESSKARYPWFAEALQVANGIHLSPPVVF